MAEQKPARASPDRLSPSDMSSLLAERGPIHVHVGATLIVAGKPPAYDDLVAHVRKRLNLVPRFRQRVTRTPLGLDNPVWADDPRFDINWHVRHAALPKPGTIAQLRELAGRLLSQPLDFDRPLWQLYLIEGLEGKRHAYLNKTHHALVDGVSAVDVGTIILDPSKDGSEVTVPDADWEPDQPSAGLLLVRGASERIARPLRTARKAARSAVTMPRSTARNVISTAEAFAGLAAGGPSAPQTFLNQDIGRDRRIAYVQTRLDLLKEARGTDGATVNDLILAGAAGGLRRYFVRHSQRLPEHIVALVPMSIRREEEAGDLGNRMATLMVPLPIREREPVRRLAAIHATTTRLKASKQAAAASLVIEATGWTPPTINRVLAGAISRPLNWNLVISNVPGPPVPFYLMGRQIEAIYPFVPLSPQGHALSIGVLSYNGGVFFGLAGDRDVISDIDALAADLCHAIDEQIRAGGSGAKRTAYAAE
ncbi:MAG: wax ester/triacylglycerol synthase family O-acyltransferase [Actinomycetota bacterium]|nr:wax ester/triacylglycerol synthase family O-acyltransferase [Actinomycetota bacterium]